MNKERTEECISVIDDLLKTLEADRGWLYIGSRENEGFLRAMEAVKEKRDALERSKEKWKNGVSREKEDIIKIRYAYLTSLTNVKEDPFYREYLTFRTLTLSELETLHGPLEDLLTLNTTALIRILGRDRCTSRVDMDGKDIYEGDTIRWYLDSGDYIDETIHRTSHFAKLDSTRDCKVIGTIYDGEGI